MVKERGSRHIKCIYNYNRNQWPNCIGRSINPTTNCVPRWSYQIVIKRAFASHCKVLGIRQKTSFPKDCTKYDNSLMELKIEIPKIHFTTQHNEPHSLCSTTMVYQLYTSHFLVTFQSLISHETKILSSMQPCSNYYIIGNSYS